MSEDKKCYLRRNGKTQGPYSKSKLEASLKAGTLKATDAISVSQDGPWKAIADVPQLAELLEPESIVDLFADQDDDHAAVAHQAKPKVSNRRSEHLKNCLSCDYLISTKGNLFCPNCGRGSGDVLFVLYAIVFSLLLGMFLTFVNLLTRFLT